MNTKQKQFFSRAELQLQKYHAASADGTLVSTPTIKMLGDSLSDVETLNTAVLAALRRRYRAQGMKPVSSIFDCEGDTELLISALSREPLQLLQRPAAQKDIYTFSSHQSFIRAKDYVRDNPGATIQYGWLLFAGWGPQAIFHAAIRTEAGELILIDDTIPGLAFEKTIAFLPDFINAPDYQNCSVPTAVRLAWCAEGPMLLVSEHVRKVARFDGETPIFSESQRDLRISLSNSIFKAGLAPHEPSKILDAQRKASSDEILQREEALQIEDEKEKSLRSRT